MTHPPGTIALPCGEMGRFSAFSYSLANLVYPTGTQISMMQGLSVPRSLNTILRELNEQSEWVWFMGDDHVFDPWTLIRLLDRDVDVVVPFCIRRRPPFGPVLFKARSENGEYEPFSYDELPEKGLVEVFAAGDAGMLVKRRVIDAIGDPWFENAPGDVVNFDLEWSRKIREAGFAIHADVETLLGHVGLFTVTPHLQNGEWGILFDLGQGPSGALNTIFVRAGGGLVRAPGP